MVFWLELVSKPERLSSGSIREVSEVARGFMQHW